MLAKQRKVQKGKSLKKFVLIFPSENCRGVCVEVGRAVGCETRDPWFNSNHWQLNLLSTVIYKLYRKKKRGRECPKFLFFNAAQM